MKEYDFKIVATTSNLIDAELIKHRLQNAGIEVTLSSAESSSFLIDVGTFNKVKVYVSKEDYPRAKEIVDTEPNEGENIDYNASNEENID